MTLYLTYESRDTVNGDLVSNSSSKLLFKQGKPTDKPSYERAQKKQPRKTTETFQEKCKNKLDR